MSRRYGFRNWESFLRDPQIEMGIKYTDFRNKSLGHNVSGFYTLGVPMIKLGSFNLTGVFGGGLGYFSEKYSELNNPLNVAVSTDITVLIRFGAMIEYSLDQWLIALRWDLDHYSVAAISQPNIGLNHNTFGLMFYRKVREAGYHRDREVFLNNHWNFILAGGVREVQNNQYPHLNFYAFYAHPLSRFLSVTMGGGFFRNQSLKEEQKLQLVEQPQGFRSGAMAGLQFSFDKVITNINLGRYLQEPDNDKVQYYQQFLMRYHIHGPWSIASSLVAHGFDVSYTLDAGFSYSL